MIKKLTKIQTDTLDYVKRYVLKNNSCPTLAEISKQFGVTIKTAHDRLKGIEGKGYIRITPRIARGIKLIRQNPAVQIPVSVFSIPLVGKVFAK